MFFVIVFFQVLGGVTGLLLGGFWIGAAGLRPYGNGSFGHFGCDCFKGFLVLSVDFNGLLNIWGYFSVFFS